MAVAIYTLKNRFAGQPYQGQFDGQLYTVKDTLSVPDYIALHLRNHALIRDNPVSGEREYRLGIVELGDDVSPIEELPVEVLDRSDMDFRKVRILQTNQRTAAPASRAGGGAVMTAKERGV